MKTQIQISHIRCLIAILIIVLQSCGSYKTPVLKQWDETASHNGIVHLKDCPVVCKERTVFFEEHVYDAEATCCGLCGQKQGGQMAAMK